MLISNKIEIGTAEENSKKLDLKLKMLLILHLGQTA